jgi:hypothetical protein
MLKQDFASEMEISYIDAVRIVNSFARKMSLSQTFAPYAAAQKDVLLTELNEAGHGTQVRVSPDRMLGWVAGRRDATQRAMMESAFREVLGRPRPDLPL